MDLYCKYVIEPLKTEYRKIQLKVSKKLFITKKDKKILKLYQQELLKANQKLESLIAETYKLCQKLQEYGILNT